MNKCNDMTSGPTLPLILKFTLPLLFGNLLQQAYSMVDAAIVGQFLGINPLAAVGAGSSVIFMIIGFCTGCSNGFGIPVAQMFGAQNYSSMRRYVYSGLKLSAWVSVAIAVVACLFCSTILTTMSTPDVIFDDAYIYLLITFAGVPATFFYNQLSSVIRALGDSKTPFWFLLFSTVLNILLDLFCIVTLGWGVAGAAIATVFSQALSAVLCYIYMMRRFEILKSTREERAISGRHVRTLLSIGLPMGLQLSITSIGSIMLQSSNNALGTTCVAAFTAAMRIKMFFLCPYESLGIAMATFAGQNYGAGKPERIWQGVKSSGIIAGVYYVFMFIVLMTMSEFLTEFFVEANETEIIAYSAQFLHVAAWFFPILAVLCILRYTIQGAGYTNFAMLSGVMEMIARAAVSLFAVPVFGYTAVCFGDSMAWVAADLFLVPAFIYVYGRLKKSVSAPLAR